MATAHDLSLYVTDIACLAKAYERLLQERSALLKGARSSSADSASASASASPPASEQAQALDERRAALKLDFIARKRTARSLLGLLPVYPSALVHSQHTSSPWGEALDAQLDAFRAVDAAWKHALPQPAAALGSRQQELQLVPVAALAGRKGRASNSELLQAAEQQQQRSSEQLRAGLGELHTTLVVAQETSAELLGQREKIERSGVALDGMAGELALAKVLIVRVAKRIFTDKLILLMTLLVLLGTGGIVAYAVLYPQQASAAFEPVRHALHPPLGA
jgi:hypothetical protein